VPLTQPTLPIQSPVFTKADLEDDSLPLLNQFLNDVSQKLNALSGHSGPIILHNSLNMNGNPIQNAGVPKGPNDVVNIEYALKNYGASAVAPQLEATGKQILQTTRRLNDQVQRENYSSFLNGVLNTTPTSNTSTVTFGVASGGSVTVAISAGYHQRLDGSTVPYSGYNDTLTLPTSFALTSLSRTGGIVTAITSVSNPLVAGQNFSIPAGSGLSNNSFIGTYVVLNVSSSTQFTFQQLGQIDATATGGVISLGGVYYYSIVRGQTTLSRTGPFVSDLWTNRVAASNDGQTIIAVAVVNSSGGDTVNSAAGATAPQQNTAAPVVRRM
jgi:hypothetical protein